MKASLWIVALAFVAVGLIVGAMKFADWRALPVTAGTITARGLGATTTIGRDARGIPMITAASDDDAYFALGYVHAQDRLFEMEMMRRQGQGRLAELIGKPGIAPDRFMRTLGVYRRAQADLAALDAPTRRMFERYAAGVNAWLAEAHPLPLEFDLLQFSPEAWQPADSLVWQKLMGLQLSGNWDEELFQSALVAKLGAELAAALNPGPRHGDAVTMSRANARDSKKFAGLRPQGADARDSRESAGLRPRGATGPMDDLHPADLLKAMTAVVRPILASNVWAIAGSHTNTGKPILANDPHLNFQAPSIWYFVGIETPTFHVFGATIPGVPLHIVGHNRNVAWGLTTTHSDTSDLFVEQVADDGTSYVTPAGAEPFVTRDEVIRTRFNAPVTITVRETRHGPVVSDILSPQSGAEDYGKQKRVLALAASLLAPGDRSAQGLYKMNRAGNIEAFTEALADFHAPQQNIMYADTDGGIGYYAAGRVPIRKAGDGMVPVPGWSGDFDWTGWIPFKELPQDINPAGGVLVNANNKMVPDGYPYLIAAHWQDAYRANRITEVIASAPHASLDSTVALQHDVVSLMARDLLPLLMARTGAVQDRALLDRLKAWDGTASAERWEPLVFSVWMERVKRRMFADELGELYPDFGGAQPAVIRSVLTGDEKAGDEKWCDDVTTTLIETCDQIVTAAWGDTLVWLKDKGHEDVDKVHWSDFHVATFRHLLFGNFPGIGGFGALSIPTPGDTYTVNRGTFLSSTSRAPFRHVHGASLRAIYDLSDLGGSRFALPGGQSGQMASEHYGDLLEDWRDRRYFTQPTAATIVDKLTLTPR